VVHADAIVDTRAQKVVSHTGAQFAHDHGEKQNTSSSPQLYCHSHGHKKMISHTVKCITESVFAHDQPTLRGAKHLNSTSYFLYDWFVHTAVLHTHFFFYYAKAILIDANTEAVHHNYCSWSPSYRSFQ